MKEQKGITLIALIITIIVMLILVGVSVTVALNGGLFNTAEDARARTTNALIAENKLDEGKVQVNGIWYDTYDNYVAGIPSSNQGGASTITWTKTSEGNLAVGSTVETSTGEKFYVIGIDGDTVSLLAKYNIKYNETTEKYEQDTEGNNNTCAFSAAGGFTDEENLNNNATVKADITSAVYKAYQYGTTVGVTTGRLMTFEELTSEDIGGSTSNNSTSTCPSFINTQNYWLANATGSDTVKYKEQDYYGSGNCVFGFLCGVRPVIEVSSSSIQ